MILGKKYNLIRTFGDKNMKFLVKMEKPDYTYATPFFRQNQFNVFF